MYHIRVKGTTSAGIYSGYSQFLGRVLGDIDTNVYCNTAGSTLHMSFRDPECCLVRLDLPRTGCHDDTYT